MSKTAPGDPHPCEPRHPRSSLDMYCRGVTPTPAARSCQFILALYTPTARACCMLLPHAASDSGERGTTAFKTLRASKNLRESQLLVADKLLATLALGTPPNPCHPEAAWMPIASSSGSSARQPGFDQLANHAAQLVGTVTCYQLANRQAQSASSTQSPSSRKSPANCRASPFRESLSACGAEENASLVGSAAGVSNSTAD